MSNKSIFKLILLGVLFSACAGEKNEPLGGNTIIAVRTFEEGASNSSEGDLTEVAILNDVSTPEEAEAAVANATWIPMSQFQQGDDISFASPDSATSTNWGVDGNRPGAGVGGPGYNPPGNAGSGNPPGWNPPGVGRPGAGVGGPGYNPPGNVGPGNPPGWNPPGVGNPGVGHPGGGQWGGGSGGPIHGGPAPIPPGHGPGIGIGHGRVSWNTSINVNVWPQTWVTPVTPIWGVSTCGWSLVFWNGICQVPFTPVFNYFWTPVWGFPVTVVHRSAFVRVFF